MQATTMTDINEMKDTLNPTPTGSAADPVTEIETQEDFSADELTTAPQQQLDKLDGKTPAQPVGNQH